MCWNAEISIQTFMIGLIGIFYGYVNNYPIIQLLFFFSFTLMQLLEYFIWTYYNNLKINKILSILTFLLIGIQPIISLLTLYKTHYEIMKYLLIIYIFFGIIRLYSINFDIFKTYRGNNGHLVWGWLTKKNINMLYIMIYMLCLFLPLLLSKNYGLLIFSLLTLIISLYYFMEYDTWGTMWCWIVNFWVLLIIIKDILKNKGV